MLDPARLMEKKEYYRNLLPWLREWGYNTLHFHITDDQGSALVFPSHSELSKDGAFTAAEMREFVKTAAKLGISVIPEIESLGHTRYITDKPMYRKLGAAPESGFNALDPDNADARRLLADLVHDAAEIFRCDIIHAGLDEVNLGALPRYKEVPREKLWKPFAKHAAWVHELVRKAGCRPGMWADHVLGAPQMTGGFKRDVIMFDWHYGPHVDATTPKLLLDAGFEVWYAPATSCWMQTRGIPSGDNIANLRHASAISNLHRKAGLKGIVNTIWCPWRYLPGGIDWPMALAGHLFSVEREDPCFAHEFARAFYGLSAADARSAGDAIAALHELAPKRDLFDRIMFNKNPKDPFTRMDVDVASAIEKRAVAIQGVLKKLALKARRNADRLNDLALSAELLRRMGRFGAHSRKRGGLLPGSGFIKQALRAWRRDRHELIEPGDSFLHIARTLAR